MSRVPLPQCTAIVAHSATCVLRCDAEKQQAFRSRRRTTLWHLDAASGRRPPHQQLTSALVSRYCFCILDARLSRKNYSGRSPDGRLGPRALFERFCSGRAE
jgi:hypothetical protein